MDTMRHPRSRTASAVTLLASLASATFGLAEAGTLSGEATAMQVTVAGPSGPTTTGLASTGTLADEADARAAVLATGNIPAVGGASSLHATTISGVVNWAPEDAVASEASLADLELTVAGHTVSAGFAMARAEAAVGAAASGSSVVEGLAVDGVSIMPSGSANQVVSLPGLTLVLNEEQATPGGIRVNALRITSTLDGTSIVVASATAAIAP